MKRSSLLASGTIAGVIIGSALVATPASAAATVTTPEELIAAVAACDSTITIGAEITLTGLPLVVSCALVLDLNGQTLSTVGINIAVGSSLQIDDSSAPDTGVLTTVPISGAGIGVPVGTTLTINGGTITARGGTNASAIGGFTNITGGGAGTIVVNGGTVTAHGGHHAAGIGGGAGGSGGTVTINGGLVTAHGSFEGAAIGGGDAGAGSHVTIAAGAIVRTVDGFNALGGGETGHAGIPGFGSLSLSGTLELAVMLFIYDDNPEAAEVTITPSGLLRGAGADPTALGRLVHGPGQIDNHGVIAISGDYVTLTVNDHDYDVSFDAKDGSTPTTVRLLAPDFASGYRTIPARPAGHDWNTEADGSGDWFAAETEVTGDLTLYAVERPITTAHLLTRAVAECETPVTLAGPIAMNGFLFVDCDLTLDLNGQTLSQVSIGVGTGHSFTIDDGGGPEVGTLSAAGPGPGIYLPPASSLTINEGNVDVRGGLGSAAIGGFGLGTTDHSSTGTVTINGGVVTAEGGGSGAGIGGGWSMVGGTTTINGGHVIARGGDFAAGIGGGEGGAGGTITINGGTVDAAAGRLGAGIGGGYRGAGGIIAVNGGTVTATGGIGTTGIGGGSRADGADVSVASGATVFASGGYNAIGGGSFSVEATSFGSLTVAGTLEISGPLVIPDSVSAAAEVVISSGGLLRAIGADPTGGAAPTPTVTGAGQIANHGVIALDASRVGVTVTDHNYLVGFDPQNGSTPTSVRLFAPTFASGYRTLPTGTWNIAANGTGSAFTSSTTVTGDVTVYAPPPDADGDGVPNAADVCASSDLSGASVIKPKSVKPNNFWFTGTGLTDGKTTYSLTATGGCTANDIVRAMSLGSGQLKAGLSPGSLKTWLATHS